jgi:hypothetical protein
LLFWIQRGIGRSVGFLIGFDAQAPALVRFPLPQGQIVRYTEDPSAQIAARFAHAQMPEERQEDLLDDLFAILTGHADGGNVGEQPGAMLIK